MQELLLEGVGLLGYAALRIVTLGRYREPRDENALFEGILGTSIFLAVLWVLVVILD